MSAPIQQSQRQQKWDLRYLQLAKFIAQWSKDPSTKTGAVIVSEDGFIISVGYNGFPVGVDDTEERLNNRDLKYKMIVHCERNALLTTNGQAKNGTLYTYPFMSCTPCAGMVIQAGITRIVAPVNDNPRWQEDFKLTKQMFEEAGVEMTFYMNLGEF